MQTGYVLCSSDLLKVLCISSDKQGVDLVPVESTKTLNKCICLTDLTEAKNVSERLQNSGLASGLDIVNVARLYKRFFF
jgi:hypothetical protein